MFEHRGESGDAAGGDREGAGAGGNPLYLRFLEMEKPPPRIAVTGASGHIGNVVCRSLVLHGYRVRAMYHRDTRPLEGVEAELVQGDILNPDGKVMEVAGTVRDGGSFADRMGRVACWNAVMDEDRYMVSKWNEFIAA